MIMTRETLLASVLASVLMLFAGGARADAESWEVKDTAGVEHRLPNDPRYKATVLIFLQSECPVSNQYAPVLNRLHREFSARQVRFYRVYPDRDATREEVWRHTVDYRYGMPAVLDAKHDLVKRTGASVTPEVVVFDGEGRQAYRGRINDRYVDFGKKRSRATRHDLKESLEAILAGHRPEPAETKAIGCYIYQGERED